jgi:hypothetical protein
MSKNIFCGSVRIVYAIIYTLFLVNNCSSVYQTPVDLLFIQGFGLTIGSDFYLVVDRRARRAYYQKPMPKDLSYSHGQFTMTNGSAPFISVNGVLGQASALTYEMQHVVKGLDLILSIS